MPELSRVSTWAVFACLMAMVVFGCSSDPVSQSGTAPAPEGAVDYCDRETTDELCE